MTLTLITPPAADPVSLSEVKDHLRIIHVDEDTAITDYLRAAVSVVEHRGQLALMPQIWRLALDQPPDDTIFLPRAPVSVLVAVTVKDAAGADQPVDASGYEFAAGLPGRLRRAAPWPTPGVKTAGVQIDFAAGFASASEVPADLKQAVKLLAAHFYEARESVSDVRQIAVPQTTDALIAPYRRVII